MLLVFKNKEFQEVKNIDECEEFMLKHGENIVDLLGAEVDRIENELKVKKSKLIFFKIWLNFVFFFAARTPTSQTCWLGSVVNKTCALKNQNQINILWRQQQMLFNSF